MKKLVAVMRVTVLEYETEGGPPINIGVPRWEQILRVELGGRETLHVKLDDVPRGRVLIDFLPVESQAGAAEPVKK